MTDQASSWDLPGVGVTAQLLERVYSCEIWSERGLREGGGGIAEERPPPLR